MDENTFGSTPAAMYLARTLNKIDNKNLTRAVSRRLTNTANTVNELLKAYEFGIISSGTLSNSLRLMRLEVADTSVPFPDNFDVCGVEMDQTKLVDKLRRNVQIGHIKYAIRLSTLGYKVEQAMQAPEKRAILLHHESFKDGDVDSYIVRGVYENGTQIHAGSIFTSVNGETSIVSINRPSRENFKDSVTPDLLHTRSYLRCKRQGKPHAV